MSCFRYHKKVLFSLLAFHGFLTAFLALVVFSTAFHMAGLSCCGKYSEASLYAFLFVNMTYILIYYSNFKYASEQDLHVVKRSKLLLFFLIICSPLFLLTHITPGLFCKYADFVDTHFYHSVTFLLLTVTEALGATLYLIRYEKYKLHKEIYSRPSLDASLKL